MSERSGPIIDAHAHVFATATASPRGTDALVPPERDAPIGAYRERLDAAGVTGAVLVPLDAHDDYVATVLPSLPPSFAAVAVASEAEQGRGHSDPVAALRARRERLPFRALRTMWIGDPGRPLADSPMWPVLCDLAEHGIALWSYVTPDQTVLLDELGRALPGLDVVLNHLGFAPHGMTVDAHGRPAFDDPFPSPEVDRVEALAGHPRFHLMFSGHYALSAEPYPHRDLWAPSRRLVEAFGADRTLWGSDSPWIDDVPGYPAVATLVDTVLPDLSDSERAAIRGGTVARLLNLSA